MSVPQLLVHDKTANGRLAIAEALGHRGFVMTTLDRGA